MKTNNKCSVCGNLKPNKFIPVSDVKNPKCGACGKDLADRKPKKIKTKFITINDFRFREGNVPKCAILPLRILEGLENERIDAIKNEIFPLYTFDKEDLKTAMKKVTHTKINWLPVKTFVFRIARYRIKIKLQKLEGEL